MMNLSLLHLHLVSDSTGETVSSVARAVLAQYEGVRAEEHLWSLVRTRAQMERVLEQVARQPGMVLFTLVNSSLRDQLQDGCQRLGLPCVAVLDQVMLAFHALAGQPGPAQPGRQHALNEDYFRRVEAMNFTLAHDDGQATWGLAEADIILVGASRTSKSPTCMYLAHRGYKAGNVPYVHGVPLPDVLFHPPPPPNTPLIIGLTISPERLTHIRQTRLQALDPETSGAYADPDAIREELIALRRIFQTQGWPVIDVTRRSVEETAATIIQKYQVRGKGRG